MLLLPDGLNNAALDWLLLTWAEVSTDREHVESIVQPVEPETARDLLRQTIMDDYNDVRDELLRRERLTLQSSAWCLGGDGPNSP